MSLSVQEDVVGLDIPMDDTLLMKVLKTFAGLKTMNRDFSALVSNWKEPATLFCSQNAT